MKRSLILLIGLVLGGFLATESVFADSSSGATVKATSPAYLTLTLGSNNMFFDIVTPSMVSDMFTVTTDTNNPYGATVSFNVNNNYNYLKNSNDSVSYNIPSITEDSDDFPESGWGYKVGALETIYHEMPLDNTNIITNDSEGRFTDYFGIGVRSNPMTTPSGNYTNELLFTAVVNPQPAVTFSMAYAHYGREKTGKYYVMQDIDDDICDLVTVEQSEQLLDSRDGKRYWVSKLADGKCWMTQNLDFELDYDNATILSPDSSDVESEVALNVVRYEDAMVPNGYFDAGDYYYDGGFTETPTDELTENDIRWHYHAGSLYSFGTTIATVNPEILPAYSNAPNSICPKGWRLPSDSEETYTGDAIDLFNAYGLDIYASPYKNNRWAEVNAPLYFVSIPGIRNYGGHAGSYYREYGGYAMYWTSAIGSSPKWSGTVIYTTKTSTKIYSAYNDMGFNVRCLAK